MLDDDQFSLVHVRNGVNKAKQLFADQKARIDRLKAAGKDTRVAEQPLGLLAAYLSILERHNDYPSQRERLR